jgi:hypothetical protein
MKQPNKTANAIPEIPSLVNKKIGNTAFEINIFFNAEVNTKVEDKILRLIKNELGES